jgi:pimeloyl-ACP methyl ester carboxylesterase
LPKIEKVGNMKVVRVILGILFEIFSFLVMLGGTVAYGTFSHIYRFPEIIHRWEKGDRNPVLMIHGYSMNASIYWLMKARLRKDGWSHLHTITLSPPWASITLFSQQVKAKIDEILDKTGAKKVDIVAHSMGGLVSRYYIKRLEGEKNISRLITIASPLAGTYAAYLGIGACMREMCPGSKFLEELDFRPEEFPRLPQTAIYSDLDELVIPHRSATTGKKEIDIFLPNLGHAAFLYSPRVYQKVRERLKAKA